jgi:hypothetical protein
MMKVSLILSGGAISVRINYIQFDRANEQELPTEPALS